MTGQDITDSLPGPDTLPAALLQQLISQINGDNFISINGKYAAADDINLRNGIALKSKKYMDQTLHK